jgi:hypothetical protein
MVTDTVNERARVETSILYGGRLLLTLAVLALYVLGRFVPLPFVHLDTPAFSLSRERLSLMVLGITPLLQSFILVELFSLVTSPGYRLRQSGAAGRSRLNRAALITGLLIAATQAMGIALWLERMTRPDGFPLVPFPGLGFRLFTTLTLTAATAALYAMGQFLSAYGIGNGFALLMLTDTVGSIWRSVAKGKGSPDSSLVPLLSLLLAVGLAVLAFRFIRSAEDQWIPAFPQSVMPVLWGLAVFPLIGVFGYSLSLSPGLAVLAPLIAIPAFSWLTFHLFSSRPRLQANLSDPEEFLDELEATLRRRAVPATVLLTLGTVAVLAWREFQPNTIAFSFTFLDILILVAIGLDLWDQHRFERRVGATALLTRLDNVHLSYRLEERLQEEGIEALARGHQFRSLYFFFGALFKIDVLIPAEQLGQARSVLAELETAREIREF